MAVEAEYIVAVTTTDGLQYLSSGAEWTFFFDQILKDLKKGGGFTKTVLNIIINDSSQT